MDPRSLVLVHGAGNGPWVFEGWPDTFPGICLRAVDLQARRDVSQTSSADYAEIVQQAVNTASRPLVLCGWSMGGLIAMMAAAVTLPDALVLLEPSPPAEVQGTDESVEVLAGAFDPEVVYGPFPEDMPARPESSLARAERKRGISVPVLPCQTIVVSGREFSDERGSWIARAYGAQWLHFPDLSHWDLVRDPAVRTEIASLVREL
jgi:pimeloyl-ACP methyl ester carboxylesterase